MELKIESSSTFLHPSSFSLSILSSCSVAIPFGERRAEVCGPSMIVEFVEKSFSSAFFLSAPASLARESAYSLILVTASPQGFPLYSSLYRARACPTKSQVSSLRPNFLYTSSMVVVFGSTSFQVLGSSSLKSLTKTRKFLNLLFSKSPPLSSSPFPPVSSIFSYASCFRYFLLQKFSRLFF